jgi:phage FluMu gp28-like protein
MNKSLAAKTAGAEGSKAVMAGAKALPKTAGESRSESNLKTKILPAPTDPIPPSAPAPSKYFMAYQVKWLIDESRIKIWEKSRRIGATYVQSYEDVRDIVSKKEYTKGRPVRKVFFTSADESAAREYIDYCAQWAQLFNMAAQPLGEVILDSEHDIKALCIEFKNGGKIYALTSNPKRFRSKGGKVVIDEFAWHEDQSAMWKAAKPTAMWGYPIRILSTHHGKQCLFYQFTADTRAGKTGWSLHTVTIFDAVADGLVDKILGHETTQAERDAWIDQEHRDCRSEDVWQEEYCCNAQDSATAFIPYEIIAAAEASGLLMSMEELANLTEGDLYLGWDIARKKDMSVVWIIQKLGDVRYTRHIKCFEKTKFRIQVDFLNKCMELKRMRRGCLDQTGMGLPITEAAQEKWGTYRVEGVTMTNATKEAIASDAKNALEDVRARIPSDETVRESFHSIKKIVTAAGNNRYDADSTEETGHADHWWAFCLCEHAAKKAGGPVRVGSAKIAGSKSQILVGYD